MAATLGVAHELPMLIALGYEDLVDHDDLRRDPVLGAVLGQLEAERPRAGAARRQEHAEPARARVRGRLHGLSATSM
jgi:hypothetical protein